MDELEFCTDLEELTAREQVAHLKTTRAMHRLMEQQFILDLEEERRLAEQQFIRDCIELALDENTGLCAEDV